MDTITKVKISTEEKENTITKEKITKSKFKVKSDPALRMSYIVPEEIYPENIEL